MLPRTPPKKEGGAVPAPERLRRLGPGGPYEAGGRVRQVEGGGAGPAPPPPQEPPRRPGGVGLHEAGVRVGQVEEEKGIPPPLAADPRHRLAEVGLAMPGRVDQRNEHLLALQPPLPDIGLHDRLAAGEAVL